MFGYVVPLKNELKIVEFEIYRSIYCGLCKQIKRDYGRFPSMFLSYDFVFFALYLENLDKGKGITIESKRCGLHPFKKRPMAKGDEIFHFVASVGVQLSYHKIKDNINDEKLFGRIKNRVLEFFLRPAYQKAAKAFPECDKNIRQSLDRLSVLEKQNCASLDEPADTFAVLLKELSCFMLTEKEEKLITAELFRDLGRFIYLIDAYADLEEDLKNHSYNPILLRYSYDGEDLPQFRKRIKEQIDFTLTQSLANAASAFDLLPTGNYSEIIKNILYLGLSDKQRSIILSEKEAIKHGSL